MSDSRIRDLERAVLTGGGEEERVALSRELERVGRPNLWGYAPRWCEPSEAEAKRHLPGVSFRCAGCKAARDETARHIMATDAITNGSDWTRIARANVGLVVRVMPPGSALRDIRAALREANPHGKHGPSWGRKVWGNEVGRAFPALSRKPALRPLGSADSPLFADRSVS